MRAEIVKGIDGIGVFANNDDALTGNLANNVITRFRQLLNMPRILPASRKNILLLDPHHLRIEIDSRLQGLDNPGLQPVQHIPHKLTVIDLTS